MHILKYKDYEGTAEVDMDRCVCRGKILFINDLVTYEADTPQALKLAFELAVDDYLETCEELGRDPKKTLKGQFNVRISPELHRKAVVKSQQDGISLNELVGRSISSFIEGNVEIYHNYNIFSGSLAQDKHIETFVTSSGQSLHFLEGGIHATN